MAPTPSSQLERSVYLQGCCHSTTAADPVRRAGADKLMVRKMQNAKSVCMMVLFVLLLATVHLGAQQRVTPVQPAPAGQLPAVSQTAPATGQNTAPATDQNTAPAPAPSTYLLGPDDLIVIQGLEMEEIVNK